MTGAFGSAREVFAACRVVQDGNGALRSVAVDYEVLADLLVLGPAGAVQEEDRVGFTAHGNDNPGRDVHVASLLHAGAPQRDAGELASRWVGDPERHALDRLGAAVQPFER